MNSVELGSATSSGVEVSTISIHGLWLYVREKEYFLPFDAFPWFREGPISAVFQVVEPFPGHLYWPRLDIDLTLEQIEHPERFPLVARCDDEA